MSKVMDEQLKLAHKLADVVDRANIEDLCDSAAVQSGLALEFLCPNPIFLQGRRRTRSFKKLAL